MTRIDQIGPLTGATPTQDGKSGQKSQGTSFADTLEQALATPSASESTTSLQASQTVTSQAPVQAVEGPQAVDAGQVVAQAERTLAALENFQSQLGDPSRSLKQMAPVVEELEGEASRLLEALNQMDPSHELHPVLENVASTSLVQAYKFKRGDYIAG